MESERWQALMKDDTLPLTAEEIAAGWHFCMWGWDGLLIGPGMEEMKYCCCDEPGEWDNAEKAV